MDFPLHGAWKNLLISDFSMDFPWRKFDLFLCLVFRQAMAAMDVDGSGEVDFAEFDRWCGPHARALRPCRRARLKPLGGGGC